MKIFLTAVPAGVVTAEAGAAPVGAAAKGETIAVAPGTLIEFTLAQPATISP
jgi:hypothetical protein